MKYIKQVRVHFSKQPVFSIRELRTFLAKQRISNAYSNLLIHNLLKTGELRRITRGVYTFRDDLSVAGFAFSPFYYGLQEALSLRNLWAQETNPVIITPKKARTGLRTIMDANVLVRRISRRMFFGFEMLKHYDYWLPVSDAEKTLIDFAHFNEPLPEETLQELKSRIDRKKLSAYLKRAPEKTVKRVRKLLSQPPKIKTT